MRTQYSCPVVRSTDSRWYVAVMHGFGSSTALPSTAATNEIPGTGRIVYVRPGPVGHRAGRHSNDRSQASGFRVGSKRSRSNGCWGIDQSVMRAGSGSGELERVEPGRVQRPGE